MTAGVGRGGGVAEANPLPAFLEGWALNSFNGVTNAAPPMGGTGSDSESQIVLEYTVSGTQGGATLTIASGDQSKGTGTWGGVIQHDDGTYGLYTVHSLASDEATVWPPLRGDVTAGTLRNLAGTGSGQHYTEPGYRALARAIFGLTNSSGYREKFAAQWLASTGAKADWTNTGGLLSGQYSYNSPANAFVGGTGQLGHSWFARGRAHIGASPGSPYTGKGVTKTFALGGATGYMEAFVACAMDSTSDANAFASFRVTLVADSVTIFDQSYDATAGLQRVIAPYSGVTSATLTITRDGEESGGYDLRVGDVTFWSYDRSITWSDRVIGINDKVVVIGDSWTTYYTAALGDEIAQAQTDAGGTSGSVVSVGMAGQTAEWGLANFDTLVAPEAPDVVVVLFFTNDQNSYGVDGYQEWLDNMYAIGAKCQAIAARPLYVMPLPTASIGQASSHGLWAERLGAGIITSALVANQLLWGSDEFHWGSLAFLWG